MTPEWDEKSASTYARNANSSGMGLFGPSLRRFGSAGRDPVCDEMVRRGAMQLVTTGMKEQMGYWLIKPDAL